MTAPKAPGNPAGGTHTSEQARSWTIYVCPGCGYQGLGRHHCARTNGTFMALPVEVIPVESVQAVAERWREQARELIFTCNTSKLNPHENKVTYGKAQGLREAAAQLTSLCNRGSNDAT